MTLQFSITQNVLFHIITHLDFCLAMAASAAAEIAARWCFRLPIKDLTQHYNSRFCVSFNFFIDQEARIRLYTRLNGALT